jgi:protein-tyrosine-phosphatase
MTSEAYQAADIVINMTGKPREEAFLEHATEARTKVEDWIVRDPYGADADTYQRVFEGIQRRVGQLAEGLRTKRQNRTTGK